MKTKAIYAFSGDPITYGHIDIIKRALQSFGSLIVAIGDNPEKHYLFDKFVRTAMAKKALEGIENITVLPFQGMLTDFAYEQQATIVVRGIRDVADFQYENLLFKIGRAQAKALEFHYMLADEKFTHISSGAAKAIQLEQGNVLDYVPLYVKSMLEQKISNQAVIGITGEIGAGKTHLTNLLSNFFQNLQLDCHYFDTDKIVGKILEEYTEPVYQDTRDRLAHNFGDSIIKHDGFIKIDKLKEKMFESRDNLLKVNEIMTTPVLHRLRKLMHGQRGVILIESALFAELDLCSFTNNRVVLVDTPKDCQLLRLHKRGLNNNQIATRLEAQMNTRVKAAKICQAIENENFGRLWHFHNNEKDCNNKIKTLGQSLLEELKMKENTHVQLFI